MAGVSSVFGNFSGIANDFTSGANSIGAVSGQAAANAVQQGVGDAGNLGQSDIAQASQTIGLTTAEPLSATNVTAATAHKVLIGVVVMVAMLIFMVEASGSNHQWAVIFGLLLFGVLVIEGMNHIGNFSAFAANNPFVPAQ